MRQILLLLFISFGTFAQSSLSFLVGGTDRTLQQAATRRDVLLHYTSLGGQYGRFLKPTAEVFGGVSYGFDLSSPARSASASAGMRYFLKPLSKRFVPFGQFSGELLFDNSYALTNRDADFVGSAGLGIDFKAASAVSLRGSVALGLPFFSSGSLSPFTNSGSNVFAGLSVVFRLPSPVKAPAMAVEAIVAAAPAVVAEAPATAVAAPVPVVAAPAGGSSAEVVAVAPAVAPATAVATVASVASVAKADVDLDSLFNTQIYFKTDKSWVGPESAKKLDRIIELMAEYPDVKIHLKGHTDYRKSDDYNLKLSLKRVQNVRLYLVQHGVAAARFKAEAFSEEAPASRTDLQLNRRVEVRIWR
ncbi:OmpA family protein [Aquirufa lenticrescens]|uniref:OmpA family protein n=1 Tax=Aquirufa lenticrescens TaxID=2696560 RepID=UPI001CAA5A41|nr:OmpA family protein [Aquirufa lenticrescens]UAJ14019.1 OmpA family protein [Aquirufa lenticrescens]